MKGVLFPPLNLTLPISWQLRREGRREKRKGADAQTDPAAATALGVALHLPLPSYSFDRTISPLLLRTHFRRRRRRVPFLSPRQKKNPPIGTTLRRSETTAEAATGTEWKCRTLSFLLLLLFSGMGEEASRFYVAAPMIPLPPPPFFPASKSLPAESGNGGGSIVSYGALIFTCRRRRHCPLFTTEQTEAEATPFLFLPIPFFCPAAIRKEVGIPWLRRQEGRDPGK